MRVPDSRGRKVLAKCCGLCLTRVVHNAGSEAKPELRVCRDELQSIERAKAQAASDWVE